MDTREESVGVPRPASGNLDALALKAEVGGLLFGDAATPITVGTYQIRRALGRGGMGVVYAAWDDALGREVAIKLLPAERVREPRQRARLVREAQALAKVSHPNVVQVYGVGEYEDSVFVTMELVEGVSLHRWQQGETRTTDAIIEVYTQAGQGLHAAHVSGLVHRDFKPSNVLVGKDGRVRVLDFGLARGPGLSSGSGSGSQEEAPVVDIGHAETLTRTGTVMGTPAYMAPEQYAGHTADARADQFSFCVALYEALVGCRPFDPADLGRTQAQALPAPTKGDRPIPLSLRAPLRRGLSLRPNERFPSMESLLRAMGQGSRWRRRAWTWGPPLGLVGLAVAVVAHPLDDTALGPAVDASCTVPSDGPGATWTDDGRARVEAALVATEQPYATDTWRSVAAGLTTYEESWNAAYLQACTTGGPTELQQRCLDHGTQAFEAAVATLATIDSETAPRALAVVDELDDPSSCVDATDGPLKPADSRLVRQLEDARALATLGRYGAAEQQLRVLSGRREELENTSTYVELLLERGTVLHRLGKWDEASRVLRSAAVIDRAPPEMRVRAFFANADLAREQERFRSATDQLDYARAVIDRETTPDTFKADLLDLEGRIATDAGDDLRTAEALHREALTLRPPFPTDAKTEPDEPHPATLRTMIALANTLAVSGQNSAAREYYEKIRAAQSRRFGEQHPEYAAVLFDIGLVELADGHFANAITLLERARAIELAAYGQASTAAARSQVMLAQALLERGEYDAALRHAREAWDVQRQQLPKKHSDREAALRRLASIEMALGPLDDSLAHHIALIEEFGRQQSPEVLNNIAFLYCQVGRCAEAAPWISAARAQFELHADVLPPDQQLTFPLYIDANEVSVEMSLGNFDVARTLIRRVRANAAAIEIPQPDDARPDQREIVEQHAALVRGGIDATIAELDAHEAVLRKRGR